MTSARGSSSRSGSITTVGRTCTALSSTTTVTMSTASLSTSGSMPLVTVPSAAPGAKGPRMCNAVVDLGGDIMRDALYYHITPQTILHHVHSSPYLKMKPMTAQQLRTLANSVKKGNYKECDITLLYAVLRNCTVTNKAVRPTKGWGTVPVQPGDINLGDDLERLRIIRNAVYGHVPSTDISESDYYSYMKELQDICIRMDTIHSSFLTSPTPVNRTYSQRLKEIQTCCVDPETEAMYVRELTRLAEEEKKMMEKLEHLSDQQTKIGELELRLDGNASQIEYQREQLAENRKEIDCHSEQIEHLQGPTTQKLTAKDVANIQKMLTKLYDDATRCIQVMPLDEEGVALSEIYGSVLVEEDLTALKKTRRADEPTGNTPIETLTDMFYVINTVERDVKRTLAKRIFVKGEAGHGKTVLCLKLIETWSKAKQSGRTEREEKFSGLIDIESTLSKSVETQTMINLRDACAYRIETAKGGLQHDMQSREYCEHNHTDVVTHGAQASGSRKRSDAPLAKSDLSREGEEKIPRLQHFVQIGKEKYDKHEENSSQYMHTASHRVEDSDLQCHLNAFEGVFYVPMRDVKHEQTSVLGLVCDSVGDQTECTKQKIREMLKDDSIPCLVILDGLDEWNMPSRCRVRGFPDTDGLANCVLCCTMRPWRMINLRIGLDRAYDKVVQILGISSENIETVIRNVLRHFYGMNSDSKEYKQMLEQFCLRAKQPELHSLLKIPLMLTASCVIWKEEFEDENSVKCTTPRDASHCMTLFHLKLLEIKIARAENKHMEVQSFLYRKRQNPVSSRYMPEMLSKFSHIIDFFDVIESIGRLALKDLISEETHLVFPKSDLEREIGQFKVDLAMKAGILNQTKSPGLSYQQRVSVTFYHKSVQELMAALVIACGDSDALASFCIYCNTVDKVMNLSNMITFACGLNPEKGCQMCEHVSKVDYIGADIYQYREKPTAHGFENMVQDKINELFKMQCKWHNEMKKNPSYTYNTGEILTSTVCDVYLDDESGSVMVSFASEVMGRQGNSIISICLNSVENSAYSVINHLPLCANLSSLYIMGINDTKYTETLATLLPRLVHLQHVSYRGRFHPTSTAVVNALQQLTTLRCIELEDIDLTSTIKMTGMSLLDTVVLSEVRNAHFILPSLCQYSQLKYIELHEIVFDDTVLLSDIPLLETVVLTCVGHAHFVLPSLPCCVNLTTLHISRIDNKKDRQQLASVLPQLAQLQYIRYRGAYAWHDEGDTAVVCALRQLKQLKHVELKDIQLIYDDPLLVTPLMTQLEKIALMAVRMEAMEWEEFVSSLLNVQQTVQVSLTETSIDTDTVTTIKTSPLFKVIEGGKMVDERHLWFYTVPKSIHPH